MRPFAKVGSGERGLTWDFVNYTPILVGGALLLIGGWYVLSAHKWFKGPVRQATRRSWTDRGGVRRGSRSLRAPAP